ncbi:hypothetical protein RUM43_003965 [Polyplax serrata]|uniref:C2H2-type domain-containing protein n=1 Tax=Polyplax serrata TaxID=468196 RepID=A0AAN8S663_POLSC
MFNGYNDTPLSTYNEFDQNGDKKHENIPKWSYGPGAGMQSNAHNHQSEYWSAKTNFFRIAPPHSHVPTKCNCPGCYPSDNPSYQGDSTRHRPWLPRFSIPVNGATESCKLAGNHQWDNMAPPNQDCCMVENNGVASQYMQESSGKHPYYRHHQNGRIPIEHHQSGVITSVKSTSESHALLKQKDDISDSAIPQMSLYGEGNVRQSAFCNPAYELTRNMEKRLDNMNCDVNFCDLNEKYSNVDSYRHVNNVSSYPPDQYISRLPIVEPYIKAVPLNLNQNRVPSSGHRNIKENIPKPCIDPSQNRSNSGPRKIIGSELFQAINKEKSGRALFPSPKDGTGSENYNSTLAVHMKNNEIFVDYPHLTVNRELPKHYDNLTEAEMQKKLLFDRDRHIEFYSQNVLTNMTKRNGPSSLQIGKKDCSLGQISQANFAEHQYGNVNRASQGTTVHKYVDVANAKPSVQVYYPKDFIGTDKMRKLENSDRIPENPSHVQRTENVLKNENLSVHARLTRPPLIFNDPRGLRFVDRVQNSFPYQSNSQTATNFIPPEYPYQNYNQNRYEYSHPVGSNGFPRPNTPQFNHRAMPVCSTTTAQSFEPSSNNNFTVDPYNQQPGIADKTCPQQFYAGMEQVSSNAIDIYSTSIQKPRLEDSSDLKKQNTYIESIRSDELNKKIGTKISPLRLLRKKKLNRSKVDTICKSPVPAENCETAPTLDVRKFWSTWADEEEENSTPTQMVVLDCQNIDTEQMKLLQLYDQCDPNRALNLENAGTVAAKEYRTDQGPINSMNGFDINIKGIRVNCEQFESTDVIKRGTQEVAQEINGNCVKEVETHKFGKSVDKNILITPVNSMFEVESSKTDAETVSGISSVAESMTSEKKNGLHKVSQETNEFPRSSTSHEIKELINYKINIEQHSNFSQSDVVMEEESKFTSSRSLAQRPELDAKKDDNASIPNCSQSEHIVEPEKQNSSAAISNHHITENQGEFINVAKLPDKVSFPQLNYGTNENEKSNFLTEDPSNSPFSDTSEFPDLPTSEYRRNKFLDYSVSSNVIVNDGSTGSSGSLGLPNIHETTQRKNHEEGNSVDKGAGLLDSTEQKDVNKVNISHELLSKNNINPLLNTYSDEELNKNAFQLSESEAAITDEINKSKEETGLQHFEMRDILQKLSKINFHSPDVKVESVKISGSRNEIKTTKTRISNTDTSEKIKKSKKPESKPGDVELSDKQALQNVIRPKATMKVSIQKSHDLKIFFKVLNNNNNSSDSNETENGDVCDHPEIPRDKHTDEVKSNEIDDVKSFSKSKCTSLKNITHDGKPWSNKKHYRPQKENSRKKTKMKVKGPKVMESDPLQLTTPVLKIKKSRYLSVEDEEDPLGVPVNCDESPSSSQTMQNDFHVEESLDSPKIKLTFKRQKANSEAEYVIQDDLNGGRTIGDQSNDSVAHSGSKRFSLSKSPVKNSMCSMDFDAVIQPNEPQVECHKNNRVNIEKIDQPDFTAEQSPTVTLPHYYDMKQVSNSLDFPTEEELTFNNKPEDEERTKENVTCLENAKFNPEKVGTERVSDFQNDEKSANHSYDSNCDMLNPPYAAEKNFDGGRVNTNRTYKEVKLVMNELVKCDKDSKQNSKYCISSESDDHINLMGMQNEDIVELPELISELNASDPLKDDSSNSTEKISDREFTNPDENGNQWSPVESRKHEEVPSALKNGDFEKENENEEIELNGHRETKDNEVESKECVDSVKILSNDGTSDKTVYLTNCEKYDWANCVLSDDKNSGTDESIDTVKSDKDSEYEKSNSSVSVFSDQFQEKYHEGKGAENLPKPLTNHHEDEPNVDSSTWNDTSEDTSVFDSFLISTKNLEEGSNLLAKHWFNSLGRVLNSEDEKNDFDLDLNRNKRFDRRDCEKNKGPSAPLSDDETKVDEISQALEAIFQENVKDDYKKENTKRIYVESDAAEDKTQPGNKEFVAQSTVCNGCESVDDKSVPREPGRNVKDELELNNSDEVTNDLVKVAGKDSLKGGNKELTITGTEKLCNYSEGDSTSTTENEDSPEKNIINLLSENASDENPLKDNIEIHGSTTEIYFPTKCTEAVLREVTNITDAPVVQGEEISAISAKRTDAPSTDVPATSDTLKMNEAETQDDIMAMNSKGSRSECSTSNHTGVLKTKFDNSLKIQRRHSTGIGDSCSETKEFEIRQTKNELKGRIIDGQWKSHYQKSKSCSPCLTFQEEEYKESHIPLLDVPVEDIPLPPGDPPLGHCFVLVNCMRKRKNFVDATSQTDWTEAKKSKIEDSNKLLNKCRESTKTNTMRCEEHLEKYKKKSKSTEVSSESVASEHHSKNNVPKCHNFGEEVENKNKNIATEKPAENCNTKIDKSTENVEVNSWKIKELINLSGDPDPPSKTSVEVLTIKQVNSNELVEAIIQNSPQSSLTNGNCVELTQTQFGNEFDQNDNHYESKVTNNDTTNTTDIMESVAKNLPLSEHSPTSQNSNVQRWCDEETIVGEGTTLEENIRDESKQVEPVDDESTWETNFENDNFMKDGFYECEDIPTSEDLPNCNDMEVEKVSDDDKFRHMMQNCLDNAKRFLNVSNLKLFSCSVDDLLELDSRLLDSTSDDRETEKQAGDPTKHISRDVLLASCEDVTTDDLELSHKFQPSELSMEFVPSFGTDNSNNLCPEILPVDNWPYLEEEVPSSPIKMNSEETDIIPFLENTTNALLLRSTNSHRGNPVFLNGVKCDTNNMFGKNCFSQSSVINSDLKRYRRRSLVGSDDRIYAKKSKINVKRRKTMDDSGGHLLLHHRTSSKDEFQKHDFKAEIMKLKNGLGKISHLWQGAKDLTCRLSVERIEDGKKCEVTVHPCRMECKGHCTCKNDESTRDVFINGTPGNESNGLAISNAENNYVYYKSPMWQPKVMLFRMSRRQVNKVHQRSNGRVNKIVEKKNGHLILKEYSLKKTSEESAKSHLHEINSVSLRRHNVSSNSDEDGTGKRQNESKCSRSEGYRPSNIRERIQEVKPLQCQPHIVKITEKTINILQSKENYILEKVTGELKMSNSGGKALDTISFKGPHIKRKKRFRNLHSNSSTSSSSSSSSSSRSSKSKHSAKEIFATAQDALHVKQVDKGHIPKQIFEERRETVLEHQKISTKKEFSYIESDGTHKEEPNNTQVFGSAQKREKSNIGNQYCQSDQIHRNLKSRNTSEHSVSAKTSLREKNDGLTVEDSSKHRRSDEYRIHKHYRDSKSSGRERSHGKHHESKEKTRRKSESREHTRDHKHKGNSMEDNRKRKLNYHAKQEHGDISNEKISQSRDPLDGYIDSTDPDNRFERGKTTSPEKTWTCEVCGFSNASERVTHIKDHPFHCQSCHLAFRTEARFINHLTEKHKDIRNQHHCLLCELSFDTESQYQTHLKTREHKHLETVEKNTINTLFTLLTGHPCPVLGLVEMKPEWLPNQAGTVHFYHQATPLSLALQYLKMHHDLTSYSTDSSSHAK